MSGETHVVKATVSKAYWQHVSGKAEEAFGFRTEAEFVRYLLRVGETLAEAKKEDLRLAFVKMDGTPVVMMDL